MKQKNFLKIEQKILDRFDYWIKKIEQGLEKIERIFSRMDEKEEEAIMAGLDRMAKQAERAEAEAIKESNKQEKDGAFKEIAEIVVLSSQIPPLIPEEKENDDKIL